MVKKEENLYTPMCIRTFSGHYVNVFDPDPDTIVIEDIAHALAHIPRFGGHLPEFFSVAQHSIMCANQSTHSGAWPTEITLDCLLHDASEAYLLDLPKPIKDQFDNYKLVESNLMGVIAAKFKLRYLNDVRVKAIDRHQLEREWNEIMLRDSLPANFKNRIRCMSPTEAKIQFMKAFNYYAR